MIPQLFLIFSAVFVIALAKFAAALALTSPVLMADALHTFSDLIPYMALFFAAFAVKKSEDERFPYGYYKIESLATLAISLLLIYTAIELFRFSGSNLTRLPLVASAIELFSALLYILLGRYQIELGKRHRFKSVEVVGKEKFADALISIAAIPFFFLPRNLLFLQHAFVILLGFFILEAAFEGLRDSIISLLDINPSRELYARIREKIGHEIRLRKAGPCFFLEVYVEVDPSFNMAEFGRLREEIRDKLREFEEICSITVVPVVKEGEEVVAIPVKGKEVSESFSSAPEFLLIRKGKAERVRNPYLSKKVRRGAAVARFLLEKGVNRVVAKEIGSIALSTLRSGGALVFRGEGSVEEVLKKLERGELAEIKEPTRVRA